MKRSKFTETQIVSILKLAEKGLKLPIFAENTVLVVLRTINGKVNMAA